MQARLNVTSTHQSLGSRNEIKQDMNCLCYRAAILHSELLPILYDKDWNCYASILVHLVVLKTASYGRYSVPVPVLKAVCVSGLLLICSDPVSLLRSSAAAPGLHAPSASEKTVHALSWQASRRARCCHSSTLPATTW